MIGLRVGLASRSHRSQLRHRIEIARRALDRGANLQLRLPHAFAVVTDFSRVPRAVSSSFRPDTCSSASAGGASSRKMATVRFGAVFLKGLAASTCASSAPLRTSTWTGLPAYASSAASSAALTWASPWPLSNTTLPLAIYVRTAVKPAPSHMLFSSVIGNLPVPPTFTARKRATKVVMAVRVAVGQELQLYCGRFVCSAFPGAQPAGSSAACGPGIDPACPVKAAAAPPPAQAPGNGAAPPLPGWDCVQKSA